MSTANTDTQDREEVKEPIRELTDHVTEFVETFYRLQVVNATKKATDISAHVLGGLITFMLGIFIIFFGGFALAWWLGDKLNSRAGGFLLVTGFFVVVTFVLLFVVKKIVFIKFRNMFIRRIYD